MDHRKLPKTRALGATIVPVNSPTQISIHFTSQSYTKTHTPTHSRTLQGNHIYSEFSMQLWRVSLLQVTELSTSEGCLGWCSFPKMGYLWISEIFRVPFQVPRHIFSYQWKWKLGSKVFFQSCSALVHFEEPFQIFPKRACMGIFEPWKKPSYFPLYWKVNRDPCNGLL